MGTMACVQAKAYAKINLSLDIKGRRPDGMHVLDSVMAELPLFDLVEVSPRKDGKVLVAYTDGRSYPHDNAVKSGIAMREKFGVHGVNIKIDKRIPEGAGFGGSSADGVAVIKLMQKLYNLPEVSNEFLLALGSDFPFMYHGGVARVQGVGEVVHPIPILQIKGVAIWKNGIKSPTRDVFAKYDSALAKYMDVGAFVASGCKNPFNALQKSACELNKEIENLGNILVQIGYPNVVMTGSGSAFIGYATAMDEEYDNIPCMNEKLLHEFGESMVEFEFKKDKD